VFAAPLAGRVPYERLSALTRARRLVFAAPLAGRVPYERLSALTRARRPVFAAPLAGRVPYERGWGGAIHVRQSSPMTPSSRYRCIARRQ